MWLKRVDKHSGLLVWESGNLILCHYLAGPASRHLLVNAVLGKAEKIGVTLVREEGTHPGPFMLLTCTSLGPWCSSQQWGTGPAADSFISGWLNRRQNPPQKRSIPPAAAAETKLRLPASCLDVGQTDESG